MDSFRKDLLNLVGILNQEFQWTIQFNLVDLLEENYTPAKRTNDNGKTTMNEDVSPMKNGDVPLTC